MMEMGTYIQNLINGNIEYNSSIQVVLLSEKEIRFIFTPASCDESAEGIIEMLDTLCDDYDEKTLTHHARQGQYTVSYAYYEKYTLIFHIPTCEFK